MSRASALQEREVQLQDFYGYAPLKSARSKAHNPLRVLGNDDRDTGATSHSYRTAEELASVSPPVLPAVTLDITWHKRPAISKRDSSLYSSQYATPSFNTASSSYYPEPWQSTAQFSAPHPAFRNRLRLPGKRLPLFIILTLMAIGLVVAITPVLAHGNLKSTGRQGKMALSGYVSGSATSLPGSQGDVPVIDVTSKPEAPQADTKMPSEISNPKAGEDIVGPPSISVVGIEAVLNKYGSPAAGKGQALYDLGVKHGINPAYALAFFVHESGCGTKGVARFTKSLGNIRTTSGYADYQGYRSYPTWEAGMEDWYKLIGDQYVTQWGLRTIEAIIPVYAPWGDNNNPPTYIASVKAMVDSWRGK